MASRVKRNTLNKHLAAMISWFILWQLLQPPTTNLSMDLPPEWVVWQLMHSDFPEPDAQTVWYAYPNGGQIKVSKSASEFEIGPQTLCIEWYPPE